MSTTIFVSLPGDTIYTSAKEKNQIRTWTVLADGRVQEILLSRPEPEQ